MKSKQPKYISDKTYKVTIVENNGKRTPKYFKGHEMLEVEMRIRNKISKIDKWFVEEIEDHWLRS